MARENLYSRIVAWLKILLPLVALGILSSVVFFASDSEDQRTIPFLAQEGGAEAARERLTRPEYVGVTGDGSSISLRAESVNPVDGSTERLKAHTIEGVVLSGDGRVMRAAAPEALVDLAGDVAHFTGEVKVRTSDGYDMTTNGLMTRLDITLAEGGGPVRGTAPFGTLDAGGMTYSETAPGRSLLVFNGGVKLIYEPGLGKAAE